MRAAQEFMAEQKIASVEGWMVAGASKRGWTTWDVGATRCTNCPAKVIAINPLVPIVPEIHEEVHRMWRAYGGFTWAFYDYTELNITEKMDEEKTKKIYEIVDPESFMERLGEIPKYAVLSSDDEFMMMDWTELYWNKMKGEKHLLIVPNAEHSLATGLYTLCSTMGTYLRSVAAGHSSDQRPTFEQSYDNETGAITVTIPKQF